MLQVTVNGTTIELPIGRSVPDAVRAASVAVPTCCHDDRLEPDQFQLSAFKYQVGGWEFGEPSRVRLALECRPAQIRMVCRTGTGWPQIAFRVSITCSPRTPALPAARTMSFIDSMPTSVLPKATTGRRRT